MASCARCSACTTRRRAATRVLRRTRRTTTCPGRCASGSSLSQHRDRHRDPALVYYVSDTMVRRAAWHHHEGDRHNPPRISFYRSTQQPSTQGPSLLSRLYHFLDLSVFWATCPLFAGWRAHEYGAGGKMHLKGVRERGSSFLEHCRYLQQRREEESSFLKPSPSFLDGCCTFTHHNLVGEHE